MSRAPKSTRTAWVKAFKDVQAERDKLKAENERLREALHQIDDMCDSGTDLQEIRDMAAACLDGEPANRLTPEERTAMLGAWPTGQREAYDPR